jgi:hypothetical protein
MPLTESLPWSSSIIKGKGVFPYSYFDCEEKLDDKSLPSIDDFFDILTKSPLSEEDYNRAQEAWKVMGCLTFSDYMMNYLKMDVFQLADVFQAFRELALTQDGLDPVNFVSIPGLSWESAFKMTGVSVELLQESVMYDFFESGTRGGITFVNKHHLARNSPRMVMNMMHQNPELSCCILTRIIYMVMLFPCHYLSVILNGLSVLLSGSS